MKLCGIIAEFNPLTNGHDYFIKKAKQLSGADIAVIQSGNFSQRGELTILDKFTRATHAIMSGADIVFELPTCFVLSSAPYFAYGGVKILADIGITHLAFGVKIDNPDKLVQIAKLKCNEDKKISSQILAFMKLGQNYSKAIIQTYKQIYPNLDYDLDEIFNEPNNILAVEYLCTIYSQNLDITPIFINRQDSGYNKNKITTQNYFGKKTKTVNATYIRNLAIQSKFSKIKKLIPTHTLESLKNNNHSSSSEERLDAILLSELRKLEYKDFENLADFNVGLSHLVKDSSSSLSSRKEICQSLESKCYRKARINKLLLIPYFNIKKGFSKSLDSPYAINVLAVKSDKRKLLSSLIKTSRATLISSVSDLKNLDNSKSTFIKSNQQNSNLFNLCNKQPQKLDKTLFIK